MWTLKSQNQPGGKSFEPRWGRLVDRDFQVKYTFLLVGSTALGMLMVMVPIIYLLNQNYKIFVDLAYDHAPQLLDHLQRERRYMETLMATIFTGLVIFLSVFGIRITERIVGPVKVVTNHLKFLNRGHWYRKPVRVRDHDEFQEFIEAYNYFYSSFRKHLLRDYDLLRKIHVDEQDKDSSGALKTLIEERTEQLDLPAIPINPARSEASAESHASRSAS